VYLSAAINVQDIIKVPKNPNPDNANQNIIIAMKAPTKLILNEVLRIFPEKNHFIFSFRIDPCPGNPILTK